MEVFDRMNSRFDKPFRQAQGPEPAEGLKALSLPKGIYRITAATRQEYGEEPRMDTDGRGCSGSSVGNFGVHVASKVGILRFSNLGSFHDRRH